MRAMDRSAAQAEPVALDEVLQKNRVLRGLGPGARAKLAERLEKWFWKAGTKIVGEGDEDRSLWLLLSGEASFHRDGMELGRARGADHFGEIALILGRRRSATVRAETDVEAARLSPEAWRMLRQDDPSLALLVAEVLFSGVTDRLNSMTDHVGALLKERSLPRRTEIEVEIRGKKRRVHTGALAGALLPASIDGAPVVAALVDRKAVSLSTPLGSGSTLEPLTFAQPEGQRVVRRSLALLALEAAHELMPELELQAIGTLSTEQRLEATGTAQETLDALVPRLQARMEELCRQPAKLREEWWTADEAREHFQRHGWLDAAKLLLTWRHRAVPMLAYGQVYALGFETLLDTTEKLPPFRVGAGEGCVRLWLTIDEESATVAPRQEVRREASSGHDRWLGTLGITSVGAFNRACIDGDVAGLIRVSEGFQEKHLSRLADEIRARADDVRVVTVAGPSSSGKTTFLRRLTVQLQVNGLVPRGLGLDDYYVDREETPRDAAGGYDFEALEALQLPLLQEHLRALLEGQQVATPKYDFVAGRSLRGKGPTLQLRRGEVLLVEGIHGLNPKLVEAIDPRQVYRIFVCPIAQLPIDRLTRVDAADMRLLRRIVRDRHGRGHDAAATILRWPSVRDGERKHIFPFQRFADAMFDTSLLYEPSVLKVYAERYLLEVPQGHEAWTTAFRLLQLLDRFVTIYPDHVPPTSILREFIGGSGFEG